MSPQKKALPLGSSGQSLGWKDFQRARKYASKFSKELLEQRPLQPSERHHWLRMHRLLPDPGKISGFHDATWGRSELDYKWLHDCFSIGLIGIDRHTSAGVVGAIRDCADVKSPVLIRGETGTGKEVVAKCIRKLGEKACKPFVAINCSGIPTQLLEGELFGYVEGAFTGADRDNPGRIFEANGGTLFFDEIGDMPLDLQAKILRVLQERKVVRLGESEERDVDVRIISATNRDLEDAIEKGQFRADLLYRLNTMEIGLHPLYLRPGDLSIHLYLAVVNFNKERGTKITGVTQGLLDEVYRYRWPGNVRELSSKVERACNVARNRPMGSDTLAGLDIAHLVDTTYIPHAVDAEGLDNNKKIPLESLKCFDAYAFMERRDRFLVPESQGQWRMSHRTMRMARMVSSEETGPVARPDPFEGLTDYTLKEVERRYFEALLKETGGNKAETRRRAGPGVGKDRVQKIKDGMAQ